MRERRKRKTLPKFKRPAENIELTRASPFVCNRSLLPSNGLLSEVNFSKMVQFYPYFKIFLILFFFYCNVWKNKKLKFHFDPF